MCIGKHDAEIRALRGLGSGVEGDRQRKTGDCAPPALTIAAFAYLRHSISGPRCTGHFEGKEGEGGSVRATQPWEHLDIASNTLFNLTSPRP